MAEWPALHRTQPTAQRSRFGREGASQMASTLREELVSSARPSGGPSQGALPKMLVLDIGRKRKKDPSCVHSSTQKASLIEVA